MAWLALRGAVITGFVALALQGGTLAWVALVGGLGALLPVAGWRPLQHSTVWGWFTAAILVGLGAGAWLGVPASVVLGTLLAYLQVHRRITGRGRPDDRVSLLLSALMLVASAGAGTGPPFLIVAIVWGLCLPMALMPAGGRARVAVGQAALVVGLAALLFVVAPRPQKTDVGGGERVQLTGFSNEVQLGDLDELLRDPEVVFRARVHEAGVDWGGRVYWRGVALDAFDGRRWRATLPPSGATEMPQPARVAGDAVRFDVLREPSADGTLFVPGQVLFVDAGVPVARDPHGAWFVREQPNRIRYEVIVVPPFGTGATTMPAEREGDPVLARSRLLPGPLRARVEGLAKQLGGTGDAAQQAARIASHLRKGFTYTRAPGRGDLASPLDTFLFERREGHCEYFATALAVLLRANGHPARVVNGFATETPPLDGWFTVRKHHAHSWVEVHVAGEGWLLVDATPGPGAPALEAGRWGVLRETVERWWLDGFLAYDGARQRQAIGTVPGGTRSAWGWLAAVAVALAGALAGIAVVTWASRLRRRRFRAAVPVRRGSAVARLHERARQHLAVAGVQIPPSLPPVAAADWYAERHPGAASEALRRLAWLYYDTVLGGVPSREVVHEARSLARQVREASAA